MAVGALETAFWDASAKAAGLPLWVMLGGLRTEHPVGASLGIQDEHRKNRRNRLKTRRRGVQTPQVQNQTGLGRRAAPGRAGGFAGDAFDCRREQRLQLDRRARVSATR